MPQKKKSDKQQMAQDYKNFTIYPVDISFGKLVVLENTKLSIMYSQHYGLVGKNGIGKTSLLNAIATRILNIPEKLDIIYVKQEEPESQNSVISALLASDEKLYQLNKRIEELEELIIQSDAANELIDEYDKITNLVGFEYQTSKARAQKILYGLGFSSSCQEKSISDYSGGWRMRISLAKALFMVPTLLVLDEPTNHLDLYGNIWLTEYLKSYPKTLIVVSHDKYFIDEVCTTIIHIENKKLNYYVGNYDKFQKQLELERNKNQKDWVQLQKKIISMRKAKKTQNEIDEYIKSKQLQKPEREYKVKIVFMNPNEIKGSFICLENIYFGYGSNTIYKNVTLSINPSSRIAIVGRNGIGKSTLLKLINKDIEPLSGTIHVSPNIRIGYYNQHFDESMPFNINPVEYLMYLNKEIDITTIHKYLSMFGLEPIYHKTKIGLLSGGQKARVKFSSFGVIKPHLLMLDEPTNHLDIVSIESLINALNSFIGAIILVTHNFDMITKLNSELYIIDDGLLKKYSDGYDKYIQEVYSNSQY